MKQVINMDWRRLRDLNPKKKLPLHPYFTRQSINLIEEYISFFTKEGDIVLDPFCGSGTTGIAASLTNRNSILYDLSPLAVFISKSTYEQFDLDETQRIFDEIEDDISEKIDESYSSDFEPENFDYPNIRLPKSSDAKDIGELFTARNLYNLKTLLDRINQVDNLPVRNFLRFIFSGILARASKTFFYDRAKWGGGNSSIFTKYRYWIPPRPDERNVWKLFKIRFNRVKKLKGRLQERFKGNILFRLGSATNLNEIPNESVDYIYTDPPYGSNIAYLDLSAMWLAWLDLEKNIEAKLEAIEGGSLENTRERYLELMSESFKEMYRVLKPGKYLSLVFQHKDPNIWYELIEKCQEKGFQYVNTFSYPSYYRSFHKINNPLSVISGQLIINFQKNGKGKYIIPKTPKKLNSVIDKIMKDLEKDNEATTENIMKLLIPEMLEEGIRPDQFNLLDYLEEKYSFGNDGKWKTKMDLGEAMREYSSKYDIIVIDLILPQDMSVTEAEEKIDEILAYTSKILEKNGIIWVISTDIRNGTIFIPVSLLALEKASKFGLNNYNSIVWLHEDRIGTGIFCNIYSNIQMFAKDMSYYFNKDPIREEHIWKDIEWGKRKFRYNKKGKDPGNVWIKSFHYGKGKIVKQEYYKKEEILERLFSITSNKDSKRLLITPDPNLEADNCHIQNYSIREMGPPQQIPIIRHPAKTNATHSYSKIIFKSSEKMSEIRYNTIKLIITSPPYWNLKDYRDPEQIGYKEDYTTFHRRLESVWRECYRVLDVDGTMWVNVNSRRVKNHVYYIQKDIVEAAEKIGFKLLDIVIWHKSSGIPVGRKMLKDHFEYVLVFAKNLNTLRMNVSKKYFDYLTGTEQDRCTNVWNINRYTGSIGKKFSHPAIYPDELVKRAVEICTNEGQIVLDPFLGSGTTTRVAMYLNRSSIGYEISKDFKSLVDYRIKEKIGELAFYCSNIEYIS